MNQQLEQGMTPQTDGAGWRDHLIDSPAQIKDLLGRTHRVAVLGIKPDPSQPAYYVPEYAAMAGMEIIPVPVYYKELTEMMGKKVYRQLVDVPGPIDMVNVFRRPKDIPPHVDDIIAKKPKTVWFQGGRDGLRGSDQLISSDFGLIEESGPIAECGPVET